MKMVEVRPFRAMDLFTLDEAKRMARILALSQLDGKPAAPEIVEQVIKPIMGRIEAKVGASFDPLELALAVEGALKHFIIDKRDDQYTAIIDAVAHDSKPIGGVN